MVLLVQREEQVLFVGDEQVEREETEAETVVEGEVVEVVLCGYQLTILPLKVQLQLHEVMVQQGIILVGALVLQQELLELLLQKL